MLIVCGKIVDYKMPKGNIRDINYLDEIGVYHINLFRYKYYKYLNIIDTLNGHTWQCNGIFKYLTAGKVYINDFLFSLCWQRND